MSAFASILFQNIIKINISQNELIPAAKPGKFDSFICSLWPSINDLWLGAYMYWIAHVEEMSNGFGFKENITPSWG